MRHINDIASWFSKNNLYCEDDEQRIKLLSLVAILFYKNQNIPLEHSPLILMEKNFEIGIYDYDTDYHFSEEEEFILNVINRDFGYDPLYTLVTFIDVADDPTIEDIYEKRKDSISRVIKEYGKNDFNTYTYVNKNDLVFFIDNVIELTDNLIERMESMENIDGQYIYGVYDFNGEAVIY